MARLVQGNFVDCNDICIFAIFGIYVNKSVTYHLENNAFAYYSYCIAHSFLSGHDRSFWNYTNIREKTTNLLQ